MRVIYEGIKGKDIAVRVELSQNEHEANLQKLIAGLGTAKKADCSKCSDCSACKSIEVRGLLKGCYDPALPLQACKDNPAPKKKKS